MDVYIYKIEANVMSN